MTLFCAGLCIAILLSSTHVEQQYEELYCRAFAITGAITWALHAFNI